MIMNIRVLVETETSQEFHQAMANRMDVSFHKYGKVMDAKGKVDEIASLEKRLQKYKETGNTEWLVDVANFAMIEYMHRGSEAFRATDSNESPGIKYVTGEESSRPHTPTDEQKAELVSQFYKEKMR
jgi:hypothetical protein